MRMHNLSSVVQHRQNIATCLYVLMRVAAPQTVYTHCEQGFCSEWARALRGRCL